MRLCQSLRHGKSACIILVPPIPFQELCRRAGLAIESVSVRSQCGLTCLAVRRLAGKLTDNTDGTPCSNLASDGSSSSLFLFSLFFPPLSSKSRSDITILGVKHQLTYLLSSEVVVYGHCLVILHTLTATHTHARAHVHRLHLVDWAQSANQLTLYIVSL